MANDSFIYIICGVFCAPLAGLVIYFLCVYLQILFLYLREYIQFNVEQNKHKRARETMEHHYAVTTEYGTRLFVFYTDAYYYAVRYGGTLREIESDLILYDGGRGE